MAIRLRGSMSGAFVLLVVEDCACHGFSSRDQSGYAPANTIARGTILTLGRVWYKEWTSLLTEWIQGGKGNYIKERKKQTKAQGIRKIQLGTAKEGYKITE